MKGGYKKFKFPFTNIYLIHWKPQTITPIHPHPNIECSFMVLKGELEENIYHKMNTDGYYMVNKKILKQYQCSHINDLIGEHSVKNLYDTHACSLHYYKQI